MKKLSWIPLLALVGALAAPLALSLAGDEPKPAETPKLKVGATVPESLTLKDFEGESLSFKELRGKVVLLHFWSDRCPAEVHANPVFKAMEERYAKSKDVVMVGIASNQNELGEKPKEGADYSEYYVSLRKKRDKVGYTHPILADHGNVVSNLFQARSTPHCFVIDKKGVLRYSGALDDDPRGRKGDEATNYLVDAATAILAGGELAVTETKPYG